MEILTEIEFYSRVDAVIADLRAENSMAELGRRFGTSGQTLHRVIGAKKIRGDDALRKKILREVEGVSVEVLYQLKKP